MQETFLQDILKQDYKKTLKKVFYFFFQTGFQRKSKVNFFNVFW